MKRDLTDGQVRHDDAPLLRDSGHRLKLAVFGPNLSGGNSITLVPEAIQVTWPESVRVAQAADRAGLDAIIPVARWKGFGGTTNFNVRSFETFTWAAGLAAITERIQVFATFHISTVHPIRAAKEVATVDHISGGRMGLNIVAGWNEDEFAMFGIEQLPHDERYLMASEWISVVKRLWTETDEFDHHGKYYDIVGAISEPKPVQVPYPTIMSAATSPAGADFAGRHSDVNFVNIPTLDETVPDKIRRIKDTAQQRHGRSVKVMGSAHIVCADTEAEAKRYYDHYVHEKGDMEAAKNYISRVVGRLESFDDMTAQPFLESLIAGAAATRLIGTPEQIVEGLLTMSDTGLDGVTLSWVDYASGIEQYEQLILPLLESAGLREPRTADVAVMT
jgi:alkanesulfonate monooxygenase SsuD/methylene tetrahydromethanopterin reductase-like flavin-dependent oxidoreductase (luciferase family)